MAYILKLDETGNAVLQDGKPVYVNEEDKKEIPFDMNKAWNKIYSLGDENKKHRLLNEELEKKLAAFDGYDVETIKANADAAAKLKEVDVVKNKDIENYKAELLATTEKRVNETKREYEARVNALTQEKDKFVGLYNQTILGNHFLNSKYIQDELLTPPDMVMALFGNRFRVNHETGKISALSEDGSPMLSERNLGTDADFDEALEILIKKYPHRDSILKSKAAAGGGMLGGGRGVANTLEDKRLADPATTPEERLNILRKRGSGGN